VTDLGIVENHAELAKASLLEQYKHRPNLNSLLEALVKPLQDIENKLYEIYKNYSLAEAHDYYLDRIGTIVGEQRKYRNDDEYRLAILARIMINNGGGTPEDIISALRFTFRPKKLVYTELYPACFKVFIQGNSINASSKALIKSINPIAIGNFVIVFSSAKNPFTFAECSSEKVIFRLKGGLEKDHKAKVNTNNNIQNFEVVRDVLFFPEGQLGFAEILVTRINLNLDNEDLYLVEEENPLEMLLSYEDFIINGGSKLAEVIEND
jgi:hypothetical protein